MDGVSTLEEERALSVCDCGGALGCQCSVEDASVQLRTARQLLELFHFDVAGDTLAKLERFERGVSLRQHAC